MAIQKPNTKISATRAYELSDSLMESSNRKKEFYAEQKSIGMATIKNKVADKKIDASVTNDVSTWGKTISGNDRIRNADKAFKEASADSAKSVFIRNRADKAMEQANQAKKSIFSKK